MKRLMPALSIAATLIAAASLQAGDHFSPADRQHPGRTYHALRHTAAPVFVQPAPAAPQENVIRSFSVEPEAGAPAPAPATSSCCQPHAVPAPPATPDAPPPPPTASTETVQSFSFEPAPAPAAVPVTTRRTTHHGANHLWKRQHPGGLR